MENDHCVSKGLEGNSGDHQIKLLSPNEANFKVTSGCSGSFLVNFLNSPRTDIPQHV